MTPSDLNLPWPSFRPGQLRAAQDLIAAFDDYRCVVLDAPPGAGKTAIYATVAALLRERNANLQSGTPNYAVPVPFRTLILTHTKALQDQLLTDLSSAGLVDIRGKRNYECVALAPCGIHSTRTQYSINSLPPTHCAAGPCFDTPPKPCHHRRDHTCHWFNALAAAKTSSLVVTNYAFHTLRTSHDSAHLGEFDLLVCDEAHLALDWLTKATTVTLTATQIKDLTDQQLIITDNVPALCSWARALCDALPLSPNRWHEIKSLFRSLQRLANPAVDWCVETGPNYIEATPIWPAPFAERLFANIPRIILSSATLSPRDPARLGITDHATISLPSTFAPCRRPIIYINKSPQVAINRNTPDNLLQIIVDRNMAIINAIPTHKGIIQCASYKLTNLFAALARTRGRLMVGTRQDDGLEDLKSSTRSHVLISPRMREGVDLPGDDCRFILIPKLPFPNFGDPIICARNATDPSYATDLTARTIVQMFGRGMRSTTDYCLGVITDAQWPTFLRRATFSQWFLDAVTTSSEIPSLHNVDVGTQPPPATQP